jgi:formate C-acetyltransferase
VAEWLDTHVSPYSGDASFLAGPTPRTQALWQKAEELLRQERAAGGVLAVDPITPATITSHAPGYIDRELELIVGLQTDAPLKRAIKPKGGVATVKQALEAHGYTLDPMVERIFTEYRKTQNAAIFDAYTQDVRAARSSGLLTGLPDAYGRGRIIGDYRRVPLYGVDALIAAKEADLKAPELSASPMTEEKIRLREEVREQVRALQGIKEMAASYGCDVSRPATNAREAVQWLYMAYLAAIKEQDGAAMSMGRIDAFLDAYIERDLATGVLKSEAEAQELIDDLVIKLRLTRQLRPPAYDSLFAGDPQWATLSIGGADENGRSRVTKTAFRLIQTLRNMGPAPEPNLTVLWDPSSSVASSSSGFRDFAARVSIETSSLQFENDALMRHDAGFGSDYSIACCVSAMRTGKDLQLFGARTNLVSSVGADSPQWARCTSRRVFLPERARPAFSTRKEKTHEPLFSAKTTPPNLTNHRQRPSCTPSTAGATSSPASRWRRNGRHSRAAPTPTRRSTTKRWRRHSTTPRFPGSLICTQRR